MDLLFCQLHACYKQIMSMKKFFKLLSHTDQSPNKFIHVANYGISKILKRKS